MNDSKNGSTGALVQKLELLSVQMEKMQIAEYIELVRNPWRMVGVNLLSGLARGLGMAVGFTLLGALLIYFLRRLVVLNLPWLSDFIADIVQMVVSKY